MEWTISSIFAMDGWADSWEDDIVGKDELDSKACKVSKASVNEAVSAVDLVSELDSGKENGI